MTINQKGFSRWMVLPHEGQRSSVQASIPPPWGGPSSRPAEDSPPAASSSTAQAGCDTTPEPLSTVGPSREEGKEKNHIRKSLKGLLILVLLVGYPGTHRMVHSEDKTHKQNNVVNSVHSREECPHLTKQLLQRCMDQPQRDNSSGQDPAVYLKRVSEVHLS